MDTPGPPGAISRRTGGEEMCQACLALARRRSDTSDQDSGGWLSRPAPQRFNGVVDWADAAQAEPDLNASAPPDENRDPA
jgi:hypothetical protein